MEATEHAREDQKVEDGGYGSQRAEEGCLRHALDLEGRPCDQHQRHAQDGPDGTQDSHAERRPSGGGPGSTAMSCSGQSERAKAGATLGRPVHEGQPSRAVRHATTTPRTRRNGSLYPDGTDKQSPDYWAAVAVDLPIMRSAELRDRLARRWEHWTPVRVFQDSERNGNSCHVVFHMTLSAAM